MGFFLRALPLTLLGLAAFGATASAGPRTAVDYQRLGQAFVSRRAPVLLKNLGLEATARAAALGQRVAELQALDPASVELPHRAIPDILKYQKRLNRLAQMVPERIAQLERTAASLQAQPKALEALGRVLARNTLPQTLIARVLANEFVEPELGVFLPRLTRAARIPGAEEALLRMAQAGERSSMVGAKLEIEAGARLPRVARLCAVVGGLECDAHLAPGPSGRETVVAIHTMNLEGRTLSRPELREHFRDTVSSEVQELERRVQQNSAAGGRPIDAAVVLGVPNGMRVPRTDWQHAADRLGTGLSVFIFNTDRGRLRKVFEGRPAPQTVPIAP